MKSFTASTEERYIWDCPYCGELCESECDDPADEEDVICDHCGEKSVCIFTER